MTSQADFKRRVRDRMAKTGESYTTARTHLLAARPADPAAALHVTNGDATVPGLVAAGLADAVLPWRDVLHEGPVPDVPDAELRRIRAAFLGDAQASDVGTEAELAQRDRTLADGFGGDYVLWFEADLYDQLQLVQILATLRALDVPPGRITLICIGEFPGIAHFGGLGELTPEQLGRLPEMAATPLTAAALDHAARAWAAFRVPDPLGLDAIAATPSPELRFLAEAFDRLGREYPSRRDGLSLTERRILAAVAEGATTAGDAFVRTGARESRPFLGDTWCFDRMTRLATAPAPLLLADPPAQVWWATRLHADRSRPPRARRRQRPRRAQRRRSLDRRRAPARPQRPVALGRGHGIDQPNGLRRLILAPPRCVGLEFEMAPEVVVELRDGERGISEPGAVDESASDQGFARLTHDRRGSDPERDRDVTTCLLPPAKLGHRAKISSLGDGQPVGSEREEPAIQPFSHQRLSTKCVVDPDRARWRHAPEVVAEDLEEERIAL